MRDDPSSCRDVIRRNRSDSFQSKSSTNDGRSDEDDSDDSDQSTSEPTTPSMHTVHDERKRKAVKGGGRAGQQLQGQARGERPTTTASNIDPDPRLGGSDLLHSSQPRAECGAAAMSIHDMFPQEHKLTPPAFAAMASSSSSLLSMPQPGQQGHWYNSMSSLLPALPFDMEPRTIEEMMDDRDRKQKKKRGRESDNLKDHHQEKSRK